MKDYEILDHTADFCVRVTGPDLKTLFVRAALAMFDLIAPESRIPPSEKKKIFLVDVLNPTKDKIEILVAWLSQLLFLSETEGVVFTEFFIKKLDEDKISAEAMGYPRQYFSLEREIKAVTYHGLKIIQDNNQLKSEIIFDV